MRLTILNPNKKMCVTKKLKHVGPSLCSCITFDNYTTWMPLYLSFKAPDHEILFVHASHLTIIQLGCYSNQNLDSREFQYNDCLMSNIILQFNQTIEHFFINCSHSIYQIRHGTYTVLLSQTKEN